jgi:beta-carotene 15,15'-dioxygenase
MSDRQRYDQSLPDTASLPLDSSLQARHSPQPEHASRPEGSLEVGRLTLFAGAVLFCSLVARASAPSRVWLPVALGAIALAVGHGAYDEVLAAQVLPARLGSHWRPTFLFGYLALGGATLLLWWRRPMVALPAFLLYSAVHFGTEAEEPHSFGQLLAAFATGLLPIAAACRWSPALVAETFAVMLRGNTDFAAQLANAAGLLLLPSALLALAGGQRFASRAALVAAQLLLFRACPPIVAFAVFFCLWHTPEHLVETSRSAAGQFELRRAAGNLRRGLLPWLASLVGMGAAVWLGRRRAGAATSAVFIGLSALTVPHMVLGLLYRRLSRPTRILNAGLLAGRSAPCPLIA